MKTLLLILDSMIYFDREVIRGIKSQIEELGLKYIIHLESADNIDYIKSRDWDYIIADYDKPLVHPFIYETRSKAVVISNHILEYLPQHISSVTLDNAVLSRTALKAFSIINIKTTSYYCNNSDSQTSWNKERQNIFKKASVDNKRKYFDDFTLAIDEASFPLGIYCSSDRSARQVLDICLQKKVRVPEDVMIIGNDSDNTESLIAPLSLSSIALNPYELGRCALVTLHKYIRFKRPIHASYSSCALIHADTTLDHNLDDPLVLKAETFINKQFHTNIKVNQVLEHCHVSRSKLDKRFILIHGKTVHQFLTDLRVQKARLLLKQSNESLDTIAKRCGYPNQSYLSQLFIKRFNASPSEFRKRSK